ncbi:MAG: exonuclease SbcCD subunit D C-terminal domain-containing protein [Chlamydiia bacterium]|nr:exonuclease SbcCD subunit D C-terminal domain-containing protein [Chlamydiia bacterium]
MRILHTADWHLGRTLFGRKRYDEFKAFLDWLLQAIESEGIDVLLIAGDVFDTSTPSNRAQELYYDFLCRAASSRCKHIVVIGGNHDSPSFLDAPKGLLRSLNVHVIGEARRDPADEVLWLKAPDLIVCAVPYLRDRDVRTAEAGETLDEKAQKLLQGIKEHYSEARKAAEGLDAKAPIIAMGHLFTAGGQTIEGDGVRELYVGSLAHVGASIFNGFEYVALGHLHVPQKVGGEETVRYSGSPLPMGFGEAKQQKSVCIIDFGHSKPEVRTLDIPVFQAMESIRGGWEVIEARLKAHAESKKSIWLELIYDGDEVISDLKDRLEALTSGSNMEILRVQNKRVYDQVLKQARNEEKLDDLQPEDVFQRLLEQSDIIPDQRDKLLHTYQEALQLMNESDSKAN